MVTTGRKDFDNEEVDLYNKFFYSTDVNSTLVYYFPKIDANVSLFFKYTGKRKLYYVDTETDDIQEGFINDYNNLDLTVGKKLFNENMQITAGIKNLLDVTSIDANAPSIGGHSGGSSDPQPVSYGRTVFVSISYNFQKFK